MENLKLYKTDPIQPDSTHLTPLNISQNENTKIYMNPKYLWKNNRISDKTPNINEKRTYIGVICIKYKPEDVKNSIGIIYRDKENIEYFNKSNWDKLEEYVNSINHIDLQLPGIITSNDLKELTITLNLFYRYLTGNEKT